MRGIGVPENIFNRIPASLPVELIETLAVSPDVRIERIVSAGHASPEGFWYDQEQDEWVLLVSGSAVLAFEDKLVELKPGDHLLIPSHQRHRVESTSPTEKTIWLAVHFCRNLSG